MVSDLPLEKHHGTSHLVKEQNLGIPKESTGDCDAFCILLSARRSFHGFAIITYVFVRQKVVILCHRPQSQILEAVK